MNKNSIIVLVILGLLVIAGIGYAIWSNSNSPQVVLNTQNQTQTTTTNTVPVPVSQLSAPTVQTDSSTAPYISTVVVKGTVNPNGAATTYWYEYGETQALGSQTSGYLIGSGYTTLYTPAYIIGLKSNTDYYFRLSAKNSIGTATGSTYSFKTNTTPAPSGVAPTANTSAATSVTKTTANLNGQINPKNSATTFWFEYGLNSDLGSITSFQTSGASDSSAAVLASVSGLQPLTKYYFRLNAQNQFGTTNSQILNFTTAGPAAATTPTVKTNSATAVTSSSAKLNANVNPNGAATTYSFEYSTSSLLSNVGSILNTLQQSLSIGPSAVNVSADITGLTNNTKYYVRTSATNQYGTVKGDVVSFTTKK